ncbi:MULTISPECIES: tyrosine-type recombinase/integrase [unclassified Serratia (in: enterobacteria)]|uniref:tyrosine-type recombinase/integrase n=1 Tax=unclassified Serratia (in: enterobacteria) TaxID=2647522 RepID=UPI003075FC6A
MSRQPAKSLSALDIRNAKPGDKEYKLYDGNGLYLLVKPNGAKYWRMKYRIYGKEKKLAIGVYPEISLAQARIERENARKLLAEGKDPNTLKRTTRISEKRHHEDTFEAIAMEWFNYKSQQSGAWVATHADDVKSGLVNDVFPHIGKIPIRDITPRLLLDVLRRMEKRGVFVRLRKVRQHCHQIFVYAIALELVNSNPASDLAKLLKTPVSDNLPHLKEEELPEFLRTLSAYEANPVLQIATKILLLTGVRTMELRLAEWGEFDWENSVWTIPAEKMKMRRPHLVPLSRQVVVLLKQLQTLTGGHRLLLPGRNAPDKPRAEAVINHTLYALGYKGRTTGHGFRHTLSTILHEKGFNTAWIELQLAHVDKNSIRGTYNHALYLEQRRNMMQWYADYIDSLESANTTA